MPEIITDRGLYVPQHTLVHALTESSRMRQ